MDAGEFFRDSAHAAQTLGRRAVLLAGRGDTLPQKLPPGVVAFDYAPYSQVFPHACAVVHQGGVGTTAQVLRAGKPSLVVPYSHDQPDHAARLTRSGIGRTLRRDQYNAQSAARQLGQLLNTNEYSIRAARIGEQVRREDGTRVACDAIEEVLQD
jgi:UDP:flavonoid glycosyltransferase YjiC (YdhE family)